ncbi:MULTISPECIES: FeoA family protein [Actinomyces]|uniref:Iron transporter FeoA n=1 Tax=Actinomyces oris TaxID=544580 RepID=A0A1Q8VPV5_9ACTO|nr:FeoA family protein [Actinomyces oris]OLO50110.1 iron transporter FeoA [Actinomyces oris]
MATAVSHHGTTTPAGTGDTPPSTHTSLSDLRPGTSGRVIGLQENTADDPIVNRLSNLGFVPGRTVTPLRRAPLGDPVVYRVADYELCLRRQEARMVQVEVLTEADIVEPLTEEQADAPVRQEQRP